MRLTSQATISPWSSQLRNHDPLDSASSGGKNLDGPKSTVFGILMNEACGAATTEDVV